jgi:Dihydrofolate reductase
MGTIAVHEFVALDGVFEDPSWTRAFGFDPRMGEAIGALTTASNAILLGRRTFEMFAPAWSARTAEDDPGAPFFNDTEKHVVTSTLTDDECATTWANSSALGAYSSAAIQDLKERTDGGIYVSGSGTLVRALLADGLVDSLHLFVYPVIRGSGRHLLGEEGHASRLTLRQSDRYDNGVLHLAYEPA